VVGGGGRGGGKGRGIARRGRGGRGERASEHRAAKDADGTFMKTYTRHRKDRENFKVTEERNRDETYSENSRMAPADMLLKLQYHLGTTFAS
jgi:hypothetical protein